MMKHEVTSFARRMPGRWARRDALYLATKQRLWCDARVTREKEKAAVKTTSVSALVIDSKTTGVFEILSGKE
jgi:hypothetical protein